MRRARPAAGPARGRWHAACCLVAALVVVGRCDALDVYVAGDIAQCENKPASASTAARTARLVPDGAPVVMLGDAAYPVADAATLARCYAPTWGRHLAQTHAVPGNHDYVAGSVASYIEYFGRDRIDPRRYRIDLGGWWLIGLDSNLQGPELEAQLQWLRGELDAIRGDGHCLVAAWHHPVFSTGLHRGDGDRMRPVWNALAEANADIVLNGHEHFYEAFAPKNAAGTTVAAGLREFVVGTGGAALADFSLSPWEHRAYARRYGVLELSLQPGSYRWRFLTLGGRIRDHGSARCNRVDQSR